MKWEHKMICDECGAVNEMDYDTCLSCGADLRKATKKGTGTPPGRQTGSVKGLILEIILLCIFVLWVMSRKG